MKRNISIQVKATFLMMVFALNTVVGFACAVGVDMGFNSSRHHDEEVTGISVHNHTGGENQQHQHKTNTLHHEKKANSKGDCCNDKVIKFQSLDKSLNQNAKASVDAPVFAAIISTFLAIDVFKISMAYPPKYKIRFFYPPPPDIRIAIRSFQI